MKIAFLTYSTHPRGSVVHTWELAEALHELGHYVCIYALDKDGTGCDRALSCPIRFIPTKPPARDIEALIQQRIQEFVDYLAAETESYDIYHAQDCIGANALIQLRQLGKIQNLIRTVHHVEDFHSLYLQQCQDKSIRLPDLCLCVSHRWQRVLRMDYGIESRRVINGVDQQRFSSQPDGDEISVKAAYGLIGAPVYLTIGGIEPRKNSIRLLEAFAQVLQHQPTAQLVVVGGATLFDYHDYRETFFANARALRVRIGDSLLLPGTVPHDVLPRLYRCASAFCFPSVQEGWGLVVLEAIASGLPVITSDRPPFTEFLHPDQALLVSPKSVFQLSSAMLEVLLPDQARTLVQNSQAVLDNYTWSRSAQMHVEAYQWLLSR